MDMFMLDVTGIDVKCGDMVTIFGEKPTPGSLPKFSNQSLMKYIPLSVQGKKDSSKYISKIILV